MKNFILVLSFTALGWAQTAATPAPQPDPELRKLRADLERSDKILKDWANLGRYREENAKLPPPAAGEDRVVFMGDSITDGWGRKYGKFFPANLTSIAESADRQRLRC
jgi:hypothetical protein